MNGIHDLGGMHGFGRVPVEASAPYHAAWELRVAAIMLGLLRRGFYSLDAFRHGVETMAPAHYLRASYFERWRTSVEQNLIRSGALSAAELDERRRALEQGTKPSAPRQSQRVAEAPDSLGQRPGFVRELEATPRFRSGERIRTRNLNPSGHTRLPGYARGKRGRIDRVYPGFVFPDTNAHGQGENPQYLYNVRFEAAELWGDAAEPASSVAIDLFESYLEPAREERE